MMSESNIRLSEASIDNLWLTVSQHPRPIKSESQSSAGASISKAFQVVRLYVINLRVIALAKVSFN